MGYLGVVVGQPLLRLFAHFAEIAEEVSVSWYWRNSAGVSPPRL